jgi:2-methylisocitrate lyase-like PEP mutase family enzyme
MAVTDFAARRTAFRKLHESGCFVIPNPWDIGSARYLRHFGFQALATSSSGFAFSRGLPDGERGVGRDAMLAHIAEIVAATDLPVNADFLSAYAVTPEEVAANVSLCVATGVAGLSVEDSTGDREHPLHGLPLAVERINAARRAIDDSGSGVVLTARAETYSAGLADPLAESLRRLTAYAEAGADVLFTPGLRSRDDMRTLVTALAPKPVNIIMSGNFGPTVNELAEMGVRRISVGSALARAAWTGFLSAAKTLAEGSFSGFDGLVSGVEINTFFQNHTRTSSAGL